MINVNREKCIACELCIKDCPVRCIKLVEGKAEVDNSRCIKCGHCIAICPVRAITTDEYNMDEVKEYNNETFEVNADNLLNFIKFRRSVRNFKSIDVENDKIEKIIEAGRFTQTSTNSQDVSYIVVKDKKEELREMVLESLNTMGQNILNNLSPQTKPFERYARMWISMYDAYKNKPDAEDRIFFNAPALILVVSKTPINGGLASTNMELMTNALGLGTFYSGFLVRASQGNDKMREFLGLKEGEQIITCMVIGYPNVKYKRTVPRKAAQITWK
ncbi:MAG: nitroreductase family protein [Peptostreptococcaceae bacterium]